MTETERKALALVNEVWNSCMDDLEDFSRGALVEALCRAIEQHEAFKLEVSDAVEKLLPWPSIRSQGIIVENLDRFIIAKPDNIAAGLALAVEDTLELVVGDEDVNRLRAALAARGLEIRELGQ